MEVGEMESGQIGKRHCILLPPNLPGRRFPGNPPLLQSFYRLDGLLSYRLDGIFIPVNESPQKRSSQTRETILEAAASLIHEQGASALTLDATCARAGMSKGGLLYHFRSKEDLLLALMEHRHKIMEAAIRSEFDTDPQPELPGRNHRALIRAVFQILLSDAPFHLSVVGGVAVQLLASGGDCSSSLQAQFTCRMVQWDLTMSEDGIPEVRSLAIRRTIDGLISHQIMHQVTPPREVLVQMRDFLLALASPEFENIQPIRTLETA